METVYVGVGSNLDQPRLQVTQALTELARLPNSRLLQSSSLYVSRPMGPQDQPDYVNAVAQIATNLPAHDLLHALQVLEQAHGRKRDPSQRWGPRTLDLDILVYGTQRIRSPELTVPHPGISERAFVLCPLHEIAPDLIVPDLPDLASLLAKCDTDGLRRLDLSMELN